MSLHWWKIDADVPDPMGKIYWFAICKRCGLRIDIKYMDILPWESIKSINLFEKEPLDQFDMTMALMNMNVNMSTKSKMILLNCGTSIRKAGER